MNANIDIDLLRAFLAVVENGSFTAASRRLNRTQAAVSMQIKRLEEIVSGTLFERTSRNVELTRRGESLLSYAQRMVLLNDEAIGRLRKDTLGGLVRIGAIEDYAATRLPSILASFMAEHPNVAVEIETGLSPWLIENVGSTFDLALTMHPAGSGLGKTVLQERAVWAGTRQYAPYNQSVLPLALHPPGCQLRQAALAALDKIKRSWRLCYVSPSLSAIEGATAAGLAVTVAKAGAMPKGLIILGPEEGFPALPSFEIAIHMTSAPRQHVVAAFADYLYESLADVVPNK